MPGELARCFDLRENWTSLWHRSATGRHAHVDGLRAISILWVMGMHAVFVLGLFLSREDFIRVVAPRFMNPIIQGHHGVDVFFVISGFLIGSLLMTEWKATGRIRIGRFYARRGLRLLPAYFLAMLVHGVLVGDNVGNVWANLLYVNNYLPARDQFMIWTWSLAVEEQFYIVCPIALGLLLGRGGRSLGPLLLIGLGGSFLIAAFLVVYHGLTVPVGAHPTVNARAYYGLLDGLYGKTHGRFGGLLIGIIAAYLLHFTPAVPWLDRHTRAAKVLLLGSLSILGLLLMVTPFKTSAYTAILGRLILVCDRNVLSLAVGYLVLFGFTQMAHRSWVMRLLRQDAWYPVAQLSYSAYLIHFTVMLVAYEALLPIVPGSRASLLAYLPGLTLATLSLAAIIFVLIERPFMRLRDVLLREPELK